MNYEAILYEIEDNILTITLNRPEKLNAFNFNMQSDLIDAIDKANNDDEVKAIIIAQVQIYPQEKIPLIWIKDPTEKVQFQIMVILTGLTPG